MPKKTRIIGIDFSRIKPETLSHIASIVERTVKDFLEENLPPKSEYDLVLSLENTGDRILFTIDIGVKGGYTDIVDYDRIIDEAINTARKALENELKKYRRIEETDRVSKG